MELIEGAIDSLTPWGATGWAWMPDAPGSFVEIEAVLDGEIIGRTIADQMRLDLAEERKGIGQCGFVLPFTAIITSNRTPVLLARGPGGTVRLSGDDWSTVTGFVDAIYSWGAVGWAWMPEAPDQAVEVQAVLGEALIGRATANQMRADLLASGRGSGRYGFTIEFANALADGAIPDFRVVQPEGYVTLRSAGTIIPSARPSAVAGASEPTTSGFTVEGEVDSITLWGATGWAWMPTLPDQELEVEALLDGRIVGRARANQIRPDLADQGKGTGQCGFVIAFSEPSRNANSVPLIRVRGPEGATVLSQPKLAATPPASQEKALPKKIDSPGIHGAVDYMSETEAVGWAWVPGAQDEVLKIEAFLDGEIIGQTFANQPRQDLLDHKVGTGRYGFCLRFDAPIMRSRIPRLAATGLSGAVDLPAPTTLAFADVAVEIPLPPSGPTLGVEGHIDLLTRWYAEGWAWTPHDPGRPVEVEATLNGKVIGRATADQPRPDLAAHGKGTGSYGFKLNFDAPIKGSKSPEFRALAALGAPLQGASHLPPLTSTEMAIRPRGTARTLIEEHSRFTSRGPKFEELNNEILNGLNQGAKSKSKLPLLLAFYLPQFHPIPENDKFWGQGFTEWRQLARGVPRFPGHYQPRIPRDLGFYDLMDLKNLARQCELAKSHGIGAFAYYYYWFNRKRVLEKPVEMHLRSNIDMPFMLIWANENWTRTWDGSEADILLKQDYRLEDDDALIEDLVRHFRDPRYIRINERPLFVIYNPKNVPNSLDTFVRWRLGISERLGVEPLIFMAQTFGEESPIPYGLDGAIEFPPHKLSNNLPGRPTPDAYSSDFAGRVISYDDFVDASLEEEDPSDYPLIKTAVPSWDNDCRRPNRGLSLENIDPLKYETWLSELLVRAMESPVQGTPVVAINAWNEWAESAYLEPDVYYGAAFLNATARAYVAAVNAWTDRHYSLDSSTRLKVSVILPNYNHARFLPERITSILNQTIPPDEIIFLDDCSDDNSIEVARNLLEASPIPCRIVVNEQNSGGVFRQWVKGLSLARHELIWVAETDDAADRRFLSHILPAFGRDDVMAAFGRITCIDREGAARSDLEGYFDGLENFSWASSVIVPAFKAFTKDFSIKNVIPNASGLVFRKPHLTKHETERLFQYRFAGDWYFYSLFARGGAIAYQRRARSFFRVNPSSASRSSFFTDRHLLEHQMIIHDLRDQYGISDAAVTAHIDALSQFFTDQSPEVLHDTFLRQEAAAPLAPPLRICIAANGFAVGGGEILPVELANHLKATGCHVTYLVVEKSGVRAKGQIRQRLRNDIPVVYWDDVRGKIAQFIEDFGIQVINSHNVSFDYRLYLDKVELSIPYVASLHGGYETVPELMTPDFLGYLSNLVTRWLYLSTKNISFLSASANDKLVQSFNAVPSFEGEWVDRSAFRREHAIAQDAFVFVQCSRAIEAKGWRMSIEIVEQLAASVERPVHLVLIGDGPIAASLKADYASSRFVTFLGQVDLPVRYFKCFDMGLFPSTYEGETFPLFLLECFSAGLPVISTDIGEIPRILQRVDGLTPGLAMDHRQSPSGLREAFAKELALVMRNERTYDDLVGGAKAAAARFSMSELVSLYESVFREALSAQAVTGVDVPCLAVK